ncbi:carbohydrate sulfotransferase 12-like [Nematolebias whitei]|uniref:carbohydrate sulfotransferase 12-like n=1 Tax=Nematolebias whitei TaxID=451745 RepID=UPI001897BA68|nr:carbohydrate sulfotransferase 12-like [Nematolebias whitei]
MAIYKKIILFFGLLASFCFILPLSFEWNTSRIKEERLRQLQNFRKQLQQEQCRRYKQENFKGPRSWEDLSPSAFKNFIVDEKHGVIYCYIPKVACTNWKRVMFVLNQSEPYPDPLSIDSEFIHEKVKFTHLSDFSKMEIKVKLSQYTKFLFVRDPFIRLISAYRDKFLGEDPSFYGYVKTVMRLYNKQSYMPFNVKLAHKLGVRPSFYNFIQYLVDPQTEKKEPYEPHWRQMYRLCHPCLIEYDFIGNQETLKDDAQMLLKMLKLEDSINFPPVYENTTTPDSVLSWFRTVSVEDRRRLYELYEQDFRLFGYRRPSELLDD